MYMYKVGTVLLI